MWLQLGLLLCWMAGAHIAGSDNAGHRSTRSTEKLRIVTTQLEPYLRFRWEPGLIGNQRYEGYYVDLLENVAEQVGFTYQLQLAADGKVGSWNREDGWNGMLGELDRGAADLALGPIAMTSDRTETFHFTHPIADSHLSFLIRMEVATSRLLTSFSDLLSQSDYSYGVIRGSDSEHLLSTSEDRTMQQIWTKIQENHMWKSDNMFEALERIRRQNYALIVETDIARYYISQRPCDLAMIDSTTTGVGLGFAVRNISAQYLEGINAVLSDVRSNTVTWGRRMRGRWWRRECSGSETGDGEEGGGDEENVDTNTEALPVSVPRRHLTIATIVQEPYFLSSRTPGVQWEGYIVDLVDKMAETVPFDYEWSIQSSVGKYRNARWSGLIGELIQQNADFAAFPFQVAGKGTQSQSRVLDYTKPFIHSDFAVLLKPQGSEVDENSFYLMEDLLNITQLQFGVVRGTRIERELKRSKDPLFKSIWERIGAQRQKRRQRHSKSRNSGNVVRTLGQGLAKVRQGNFALIVESTEAAYISSKQPCDLAAFDQFLSLANFGFALKKGSSLVSELDTAFLHLQDDSILQSIFHKWFFNEGECEGMYTEEMPYFVMNSTQPNVISTTTTKSPVFDAPTTTIMPITTTNKRERRRRTTTTTSTTTTEVITPPLTTTTPPGYHDTKEFLFPLNNHEEVMTPSPRTTTTTQRSPSRNVQTAPQRPRVDGLDKKDRGEDHSLEWFFQTEMPREEGEEQEYDNIENRDTYDKEAVYNEYSSSSNSTFVVESIKSSSVSLHWYTVTNYLVSLSTAIYYLSMYYST